MRCAWHEDSAPLRLQLVTTLLRPLYTAPPPSCTMRLLTDKQLPHCCASPSMPPPHTHTGYCFCYVDHPLLPHNPLKPPACITLAFIQHLASVTQ
jgi:hypothetical protein